MSTWTSDLIGELNGRRILITGANHGIGFAAAGTLASKGADLVIAVRNTDKGDRAAAKIREKHPDASVEVMHLDLADLESVRQFAVSFAARFDRLDVLINNAGVMIPP
jgi:NAD(P)-dependent dehydrogenase (short-subunit alcohol dehydrogenase family)